ncbi:MAG: TMEM165/GDT1 family protein [Alphaproteobacteria bacterium]|jgi:putative Ca2+/H+ antiporter (TMEM165/GDT1 family)
MEGALAPLLVSTGVVAVAEIGDKTQLLALVLAARFRQPWPIVLGILVATLANHAVAGLAGAWFAHLLEGPWLRWIIAGSFVAVGAWALVPDKFEDDDKPAMERYGAFVTTTIAFFIVEIGDKTQVATVALAGRYAADVASVVAGTTLGMMLANAPAVWLGDKLAHRLPLKLIRVVAACIFVALGIAAFVMLGG